MNQAYGIDGTELRESTFQISFFSIFAQSAHEDCGRVVVSVHRFLEMASKVTSVKEMALRNVKGKVKSNDVDPNHKWDGADRCDGVYP